MRLKASKTSAAERSWRAGGIADGIMRGLKPHSRIPHVLLAARKLRLRKIRSREGEFAGA